LKGIIIENHNDLGQNLINIMEILAFFIKIFFFLILKALFADLKTDRERTTLRITGRQKAI